MLMNRITFGFVHCCEGRYCAHKHVKKNKKIGFQMKPVKAVINWGIEEQMYAEVMIFLQLLNTRAPTVTRQITFILAELYLSEKLNMMSLIPDAMEYFYHDDFLSL